MWQSSRKSCSFRSWRLKRLIQGPGGGISASDRIYFDPKVYRIILFDQRGAGKSTPSAELTDNTTWDLISDIEKIRMHCGIEKMVVFGGSWGYRFSSR